MNISCRARIAPGWGRLLTLGCVAAATATMAGCKGDAPIACRIAQEIVLARTPLSLMKDVVLHRTGDGFVLTATQGNEVRWAKLGADGTLGPETTLTVPAPRSLQEAPWVGVAGKTLPGDQVIAVYVTPKAGITPPQLTVQAIAQDVGGAPQPPRTLFDLATGVDPSVVRIAMGSSRTGRRAVVAWGYEGMGVPPSVMVLGPDGDPQGSSPQTTTLKLDRITSNWTCLAVVPSRADSAVSVMEATTTLGQSSWHIDEISDTGRIAFDVGVGLDATNAECPAVAPTPRGYVIAYQNASGAYFADYDIDKGTVNEDILAGAVRFGSPFDQPRLACVAAMGKEYSLALDRARGPEIWRFDAFGNQHGRSLYLPTSAGSTGPMSAWPFSDSFVATYLDIGRAAKGAAAGSANKRYFIKVDCPEAARHVDAGATGSTGAGGAGAGGAGGATGTGGTAGSGGLSTDAAASDGAVSDAGK